MNTTYFLNDVMGNLFHTKETPALPAKYFIGLSSSEPTLEGGNVKEPSVAGTGYNRLELTNLSEPENGVIKNKAPISFNESITDWGVMTHYVVYDAASEGHLLFYGALTQKRTVEPNTLLTIRTGELIIELSNPAS